MSLWLKAGLLYLAGMTLLGFSLMAVDKRRAKREGARRIPEATLILLACLGASFGEVLGMNLCRHKTKHPKFYVGLPLILLVQLVILYLLLRFL